VVGDARQTGSKHYDKRRGADASNYPENNDHNNNAKPTPEEAKELGQINSCTALAVFKILESSCIPMWSDLVRSHAGFARSTMLQLAPVWLM
jgi:hypothetical protein